MLSCVEHEKFYNLRARLDKRSGSALFWHDTVCHKFISLKKLYDLSSCLSYF